jgi:hypothetical protein
MFDVRELYHAICQVELAQVAAKDAKYDHRDYFGASQLGRQCNREMFLAFRKAGDVTDAESLNSAQIEVLGARMRLFNRGHMEEDRFNDRLTPFFDEYMPLDPVTGKQWEIQNCEGIFKGHMDGKARDLTLNGVKYAGLYLLEFKTHNQKSFEKLAGAKRPDGTRPWNKSIKTEKPEHYLQMQAYMLHDPEMVAGLYVAVCKDTDEWYMELVQRDTDAAVLELERVSDIIWAGMVPPKMEYASPIKNYYCRAFCDFTEICFGEKAPRRSCRTCEAFSYQNGDKVCRVKNRNLALEELGGCDQYEAFRL